MQQTVVAGQTLHLAPERAAWWAEGRTLLVADAHFGKAATFRAHGIPVPHGTTADNLARLDALVARWPVERIVFLGDFLHAKEAKAQLTIAAIARWRAGHAGLAMTLVRGNHDARAGDPPAALGIDVVDESYVVGPFAMRHHPSACDRGYVLAGHLHPGFRLGRRAGDGVRLPCFWFGHEAGSRVGVLPAFGAFTGTWLVDALPGDRVFVVAPDAVHAVHRRDAFAAALPSTGRLNTRKPPAPDGASVRLDKWLWAARFYRTRSAAADAVDVGQVRVDDARVKPAKALRVGDLVTMRIGGFEREVRVLVVDDVRVAAPIAQTRYGETEVSLVARAAAEARRRLEREPADTRKGRPTKRDRRELATFVDSGRDDDGF